MYRNLVLILCLVLAASFRSANAEPIAVVTSASSPLNHLSRDTLKLIYLRKIQLDEQGKRWIPTNLPLASPLRNDFSLSLFSILPEEQEDYWNAQYFHGITPPPVMSSEEAVLRFVSSTPSSIGYVRKTLVDARVKVLLLLSPGTKP
ncbi:hypothetical protein [Methylomicrobium lacus]|uniref:hypothetical protein n=1 Tax=Methylomicrobium lacus TaxID=136992 RepID=UPI001FE1719F|nr:hypothetical protein [Methylomicrobium lacus]